MREKTRKIVVTFDTTTDAIRMENYCKQMKLPGRLIPVPREISAGCGMAWCSPADCEEIIKNLIDQEQIEVEQLYELLL